MNIERIEGLGFDRSTGEAYQIIETPQGDNPPKVDYKETGLFFENARQEQPVLGGNLDTSAQTVTISPWAFARLETAEKLAKSAAEKTSAKVTVVNGSPNERFPVNVPQRHLQFEENNRTARVNAGLVASGIARHGNYDAGITEAVKEAERELSGE